MTTGEQKISAGDARYSYRNLDLWKRAHRLTVEIAGRLSALLRSTAADVIGRQILRSSSSVGANIAEGHGRFTLAAFRSHLQIARGSATETDNFLALLVDLGLMTKETEAKLHGEYDALIGALTNHIKRLDHRLTARGQRIEEEPGTYATDTERSWDD